MVAQPRGADPHPEQPSTQPRLWEPGCAVATGPWLRARGCFHLTSTPAATGGSPRSVVARVTTHFPNHRLQCRAGGGTRAQSQRPQHSTVSLTLTLHLPGELLWGSAPSLWPQPPWAIEFWVSTPASPGAQSTHSPMDHPGDASMGMALHCLALLPDRKVLGHSAA